MTRNIAPNLTAVALGVGLYDFCVGLWPLLSMDSFSAVTGLYSHLDVVRVIGFAWAALGASLLVLCRKPAVVPFLGIASTLAGSALALAECFFIANKALPSIFLIQVCCELTIGVIWMRLFTQLDGKRLSSKHSLFGKTRTPV